MFDFKPAENEKIIIPFFDDVTSKDGWEGHTTSKSIEKLQSEISTSMSRLGCVVTGFREGSYGDRAGFQIHFAIKSQEGELFPSRLDIACLPLNPRHRRRYSRRRVSGDPRMEGTKKMALYMVEKAMRGMFFFSVLTPGFIPFMSLMLDRKGNTLGQMWVSNGNMLALQPPSKEKFEPEEGEVIDAELA